MYDSGSIEMGRSEPVNQTLICLWSVTFVPLATQFTVNKGESLLRGLYLATTYYK